MFHAKDNWYFSRNEDGSVTIEHRLYEDINNTYSIGTEEVTLEEDMWASIVAFVSKSGDTREQWLSVKELHNR